MSALRRRPVLLSLLLLATLSACQRKSRRPAPVERGPATAPGTFHAAGLAWEQEPPNELKALVVAESRCEKLSLAGGGWRLPIRDELSALARARRESPALDDLPGLQGLSWSSSKVTGNPSAVWVVDPHGGHVEQRFPSDLHRSRCVRPLPAGNDRDETATGSSPRVNLSAQGQTFRVGGREWQQELSEQALAFEDAGRHCAAITSTGAAWRLPTLKELQALYEAREASPAVAALPGLYGLHWSGSLTWCDRANGVEDCNHPPRPPDCRPCSVTVMNFLDGSSYENVPTAKYPVRCVR